VDSAVKDEDKYVLDYFTEGERAEDEPPFKYRSFYLDDALAEAWRIERDGGNALGIKRHGGAVFDEDALKDALERITKLADEESARDEREVAALVLGELNKVESQSDEAAMESGEAAAQS
jgi:hypothetical protein